MGSSPIIYSIENRSDICQNNPVYCLMLQKPFYNYLEGRVNNVGVQCAVKPQF